jgi:hypothetical protein
VTETDILSCLILFEANTNGFVERLGVKKRELGMVSVTSTIVVCRQQLEVGLAYM